VISTVPELVIKLQKCVPDEPAWKLRIFAYGVFGLKPVKLREEVLTDQDCRNWREWYTLWSPGVQDIDSSLFED
jgi:hypothetical protein